MTAPPPEHVVPPVRTAYLVTLYPALSHAFIESEVAALREAGTEVTTFTVRPCPPEQLLTDRSRQEARTTPALLPRRRGRLVAHLLLAHLTLLAIAPRTWAASLRAALRTGTPVPALRLRQGYYWAEAVVLWAAMRRRGLRHVHVHFANNGADVARLAVRIGTGVDGPDSWAWSFTMHGPTEFDEVSRHDLAAKVASAAFVACISDYCRSQLMRLTDAAHWPKLSVVRMGVDPRRFRPAPAPASGHASPVLRVLTVGRLVEAKGYGVLVEALDQLHRTAGGRVDVDVVGDGPMRHGLQARIDAAGLGEHVVLLGPLGQDDLAQRYTRSDAFCSTSLMEGLPVVLMEAMAVGLPVVATAVAAIPELVVHGETGLLTRPGRADDVAAALVRLRDDPELRHRLAQHGRERVLELHRASDNALVLLALLAALPTCAPGPGALGARALSRPAHRGRPAAPAASSTGSRA